MDPQNTPTPLEAAPSAGTPADKGRRALGRGLSALLPGGAAPALAPERRGPILLPIEEIQPERGQPRKFVDREKLQGLTASIQAHGILQPVLVRRAKNGYVLIAGERRWRAAQLAGLREIPAVVREAADAQAFEMALVENIQREDLSPIEEAEAYHRLSEEFGLTQEQIAARVGKERTSITNTLRLLRLPEEVKISITRGELSMGHARALLGIADPAALRKAALEVMRTKMSVRAVERLVRKMRVAPAGGEVSNETPSASLQALVESLQRTLGTRVRIESHGGKGKMEIEFASLDQLDGILARILQRS